MRHLRELLRLKYEARLPHRAIARACTLGLGTVTAYLQRARAAGLSWPLPDDLDDRALEARLFARPATTPGRDRVVPEWGLLHQELKRPGVTLALLWVEYRAQHPDGYAYSQFCERYRRWARALKPSMRQVHRAGEKLFVDFSGQRPHLVDPQTGAEQPVELFVGVLGASSFLYAEATPSQDLPSWVAAHVRMLDAFQGSAAIWVPDNLKSGVTTASRYDPEVNRTYAELARHYGAVVIPARVATPTDKPKVEVSVQIAQRWILAALRDRTFFTLADLNAAIGARVAAINARPMKVVGVSRRALFEQLDRPALVPLPRTRYELAEWKPVRVNMDYHVEVAHNFYSVPYQLVHARVEARFTASTVEVFAHGRRVAAHVGLPGRGRFSTQVAHMPRAHRAHAEWTPPAWSPGRPRRDGRYPASLEDVDFTTPRGLTREVVLGLGTGAWIRDHQNLLLTGPTGIGKSWLASAFVQSACRHGFTATYVRAPRLLHELAVSRGDGTYARLLVRLAKLDLLAIDDWLLAPLTDAERRDLLEVIEDRSERASTLIASQLPSTAWHAAIGEPSVADAICDRLIHRAHRLTLKGPTMRDPGTRRGKGAA